MSIRYLNMSFGRAAQYGKSFRMAFDVDCTTQGFLYSYLSNGQVCDPPLSTVITNFLQPGDTFVDIGSHIGYFSMLALQMIGPSGRVLAFEPERKSFMGLVTNFALNKAGNAYAFNCALSDKTSIAPFYAHRHCEGMSTLAAEEGAASDDYLPTMVMTETLDRFADLATNSVRVIKIDVEGHERQVLAGGMRRFITEKRPDFIVFEVNTRINGQHCDDHMTIRQTFHEIGYTAYLIRHWPGNEETDKVFGDRLLIRIEPHWGLAIGYGNILLSRHALNV